MDKLNISTGTIVRTICLALALINMVLSAMGKPVLPIEDSTIEALVTSARRLPPAVAAWWKNNSFTKPAIEGGQQPETDEQNKR